MQILTPSFPIIARGCKIDVNRTLKSSLKNLNPETYNLCFRWAITHFENFSFETYFKTKKDVDLFSMIKKSQPKLIVCLTIYDGVKGHKNTKYPEKILLKLLIKVLIHCKMTKEV